MRKLLILAMLGFAHGCIAQHQLYIPDTLSGTSFNLTVHRDSVQLKPGKFTQTFGINTNAYLGPTLLLKKGDSISMNVHNQMGDTTTMHWHGLHVAPKNDGGPFSMIMPGMSWNPMFVVRNNAASYWYHPHMMGKTAEQAIKGDAGFIIVRDNTEATLTLPRTYGVDDIPVIVQSFELDTNNQFMPKGMVDSIVLVNGTDSPYVNMPAQVVRMRLLNASGERTFNFGFTANRSFKIIASDNGLLQAPVNTTRIRTAPGERYEILLDLTGLNGQTLYLMSYASELPMGVQGGPTMPMPAGSPPMNSPLNGIDFNILQVNVVAPTASPVTTIPIALAVDTPITESLLHTTRSINMTADSMMVMDGPFYFNHNLFDMMRIDYRIPVNNVEVWTLLDSTMVAHPFHLHDVHFYILDRNGNPPPLYERGRKDVLMIEPNETVRFIAQFTDFADTTTPYMYHCHILMHEDDGMMGQFIVTPGSPIGVGTIDNSRGAKLFPNPAHETVTISTNNMGKEATVTTTDLTGRVLFHSTSTQDQLQLNIAEWPKGMYLININTGDSTSVKKLIVQ